MPSTVSQLVGQLEVQNPVSGKVQFIKTVVSQSINDAESQVDSSDIFEVSSTPVVIKLPDGPLNIASVKNLGPDSLQVSVLTDVGGTEVSVVTLQPDGVLAFAGFPEQYISVLSTGTANVEYMIVGVQTAGNTVGHLHAMITGHATVSGDLRDETNCETLSSGCASNVDNGSGGSAWSNPGNIILNTPGTYSSVTLPSGSGAYKIIQFGTASGFDTPPGYNAVFTFPSPITPGNAILVIAMATGIQYASTSARDSQSSTYHTVADLYTGYPSRGELTAVIAFNCPAGSTTVTAFCNTFDAVSAMFFEIQGISGASNLIDVSAIVPNVSTSYVALGPITTNHTYELIIAGAIVFNTAGAYPVSWSDSPPGVWTTMLNLHEPLGNFGTHPMDMHSAMQPAAAIGSFADTISQSSGSGGTVAGFIAAVRIGSSVTYDESQLLEAQCFSATLDPGAVVIGLTVQVNGNQSNLDPASYLEIGIIGSSNPPQTFQLPITDGSVMLNFGSNFTPAEVNSPDFGFYIQTFATVPTTFNISGVELTVCVS